MCTSIAIAPGPELASSLWSYQGQKIELWPSFPLTSVLLPVAATAPPGPKGQTHALHAFWQGRHTHALPLSLTMHPSGSPKRSMHLLHALGASPTTTIEGPGILLPCVTVMVHACAHTSSCCSLSICTHALLIVLCLLASSCQRTVSAWCTISVWRSSSTLWASSALQASSTFHASSAFCTWVKTPVSNPATNEDVTMYLLLPLPFHFRLFFPPLFLACLHLHYLSVILWVTHQFSMGHLGPIDGSGWHDDRWEEVLKEADMHKPLNSNLSWSNPNSDWNVLTQSGKQWKHAVPHQVHAGSTCTMAFKGSGLKGEILSWPHDSTEPCTNLEAPSQSSSPFVIPLPCYTLLHSLEHSISSIYSNYVPLCLWLLYPSVPVCLPLAFVLIIVSLLVMTSLIHHQSLILLCSQSGIARMDTHIL